MELWAVIAKALKSYNFFNMPVKKGIIGNEFNIWRSPQKRSYKEHVYILFAEYANNILNVINNVMSN